MLLKYIDVNLHTQHQQISTCNVLYLDLSINILHSFIGNGGSEDRTIDGWMVTGIDNGKSTGNNTSFLHNVFFMPDLMSPEVFYASMDAGHVAFWLGIEVIIVDDRLL